MAFRNHLLEKCVVKCEAKNGLIIIIVPIYISLYESVIKIQSEVFIPYFSHHKPVISFQEYVNSNKYFMFK